ncbi:winged helix-turn-helix domain-containing protein [Brevibacillus dissolubilis]|uniref:winged helix-turn-helix domain-containing protein n=1 Tax=Brevibacillus dissolubilis TaxID=1844116 RepID=UPI0011164A11
MVLLNPLRAEILAHLIVPASAAELGRTMSQTPQRINYHLKALEKVGLVRRIGTRQVRNLVEVLYQAIARTFVLAESLGLHPETTQKLKDQGSLSHMITTAERIKKDALQLMEQSDQAEVIPSATLHTQITLASAEQRSAFVEEYVQLVQQLAAKYQSEEPSADPSSSANEAYNVMLAVYPQPKQGGA